MQELSLTTLDQNANEHMSKRSLILFIPYYYVKGIVKDSKFIIDEGNKIKSLARK